VALRIAFEIRDLLVDKPGIGPCLRDFM